MQAAAAVVLGRAAAWRTATVWPLVSAPCRRSHLCYARASASKAALMPDSPAPTGGGGSNAQQQDRSYEAAVEAAGTLISGRSRASGGVNWDDAFGAMRRYVEVLNLQPALSDLPVIHVAGTKGKGSVCAMAEAVLLRCGYRRAALFTSPHLVDVRERFRIAGQPISKELFVSHFWTCWDALQEQQQQQQQQGGQGSSMPQFFRFLTLLALRIFHAERVDVAILEVGIGGRLDATNIVNNPLVCGVSSLGYDHVALLGNTLGSIAWEKAGIFKPGVPALTVPQDEEAMASLRRRAQELDIPLTVVRPLDEYASPAPVRLSLAGEFQRVNAALAIALCAQAEKRSLAEKASLDRARALQRAEMVDRGELPQEYLEGLASAVWPGRAQVVPDIPGEGPQPLIPNPLMHSASSNGTPPADAKLVFYLDGAHTPESMAECARWFAAEAKRGLQENEEKPQRVLLFNCMSEREPEKLLGPLRLVLSAHGVTINHAIFVPPNSSTTSLKRPTPTGARNTSWQRLLREVWDVLPLKGSGDEPQAPTQAHGAGEVVPSLGEALQQLRAERDRPSAGRTQVLVTGSLHLVGDMLQLLNRTL